MPFVSQMSRLVVGFVFSTTLGCGDDLTQPDVGEYETLCDQDHPVQLLAADPAKPIASVATQQSSDGYIITLGFEGHRSEVWSVDSCGGDPVLLANNVEPGTSAIFYDRWPDVPVVCEADTNDMVALDPGGVAPPNLISETYGCLAIETDAGLITMLGDGMVGSLVLQPWPDEPGIQPPERLILVNDVLMSPLETDLGDGYIFTQDANEAMVVNSANDLIEVSLGTLETVVLATGVRAFNRSPSGRWVVWQGIENTGGDADSPQGPLYVLDRETMVNTEIGNSALADSEPGSTTALEDIESSLL